MSAKIPSANVGEPHYDSAILDEALMNIFDNFSFLDLNFFGGSKIGLV